MKFKEYITIIPFASKGLGGIHCSTIEDVVTFTGMILIGGPEGTRKIQVYWYYNYCKYYARDNFLPDSGIICIIWLVGVPAPLEFIIAHDK